MYRAVRTHMCVPVCTCVCVCSETATSGGHCLIRSPTRGGSAACYQAAEQPLSVMGTRHPDEHARGLQWVSLGRAWAWQDAVEALSRVQPGL